VGGKRFRESLPSWLHVRDDEGEAATIANTAVIAFDNASARTAYSSPDVNEVGALILVDCTPPADLPIPSCPVLLVRGRQSEHVQHAEEVAEFERLEHGRIVELESCGNDPVTQCPEQLAETIRWFLSTLKT